LGNLKTNISLPVLSTRTWIKSCDDDLYALHSFVNFTYSVFLDVSFNPSIPFLGTSWMSPSIRRFLSLELLGCLLQSVDTFPWNSISENCPALVHGHGWSGQRRQAEHSPPPSPRRFHDELLWKVNCFNSKSRPAPFPNGNYSVYCK
jgi:hypothetical protein